MISLTKQTLYEQVAALAGIPVAELADPASLLERLPALEESLCARIIGQEQVVTAVVTALRSRLLRDAASRPILNLLCIGPSGVGKTETAIQLARLCFGSSQALVRLDGSEYHEQHSIARLIGAPPGYVGYSEGGQLTEAVRRRPRSVVLFDEVEKASPQVRNALLQVMSAGRLTDSTGQTVDFRRAIIVLTSNLGNHRLEPGEDPARYSQAVYAALQTELAPEFLGRLDAIVVYQHLSPEALQRIVRLRLNDLAESVRGVRAISAGEEAVRQLAEEAYDSDSGARRLDQVLARRVEPGLVQLMLQGELREDAKTVVRVSYEDGHFLFRTEEIPG